VIYGLVAALGWGSADFTGAVAGRRIGSISTVLVAQGLSAVVVTVLLFAGGQDVAVLGPIAGWMLLNGIVSAAAYTTHYRALQLGPMVVVSPISAGYAVVGVALSMLILHERPGPVALLGAGITVLGVMLASTDLRKLRAGTHGVPPGLPWAVAAAVLFGVGGFILGWGAKQVGWVPALWASRTAQLVCFAVLAVIQRQDLLHIGRNVGTLAAVATGLVDLVGVIAFSAGAEAGFLSVVLVASAIFPLIAVALSVLFLHERPVPNQIAGAFVVVAGLIMLGLGS
jgi:uncharacterized membrane protein